MQTSGRRRVLVAGIGNIFLGDDAFGVEVARRLVAETLPEGVRVVDIGVRSVELVYDLLEGDYDRVILIDAVERGGPPGSLYLIEPDEPEERGSGSPLVDGHSLRPDHVIAMLHRLGGSVGSVRVVGCEPAHLGAAASLSEPVSASVDEAIRLVLRVAAELIDVPRTDN